MNREGQYFRPEDPPYTCRNNNMQLARMKKAREPWRLGMFVSRSGSNVPASFSSGNGALLLRLFKLTLIISNYLSLKRPIRISYLGSSYAKKVSQPPLAKSIIVSSNEFNVFRSNFIVNFLNKNI